MFLQDCQRRLLHRFEQWLTLTSNISFRGNGHIPWHLWRPGATFPCLASTNTLQRRPMAWWSMPGDYACASGRSVPLPANQRPDTRMTGTHWHTRRQSGCSRQLVCVCHPLSEHGSSETHLLRFSPAGLLRFTLRILGFYNATHIQVQEMWYRTCPTDRQAVPTAGTAGGGGSE